ncbi:hypothetical protein [Nonomuraea sp. B5E05]|uniref:hypothetical protein n=1 Tax=Nonomuraea sp. B5E05 TaxID=3153569 RepID=UPI0032614430
MKFVNGPRVGKDSAENPYNEGAAMKRRPVMVKVEETQLRVGAVTASNSTGN